MARTLVKRNQVWMHISSGGRMVVAEVSEDTAYCHVLSGAKLTKLLIAVPVKKLHDYGNRGFCLQGNRAAPKAQAHTKYVPYDARHIARMVP